MSSPAAERRSGPLRMRLRILILVFVTVVWGTTFPLMRGLAVDLTGLEITAVRFLFAGICLLPLALRARGAAWRAGAWLGLLTLVCYVTQAYGLHFISANRSAFLTGLNVIMVPLLALALGERLALRVVLAAALAVGGIGLMSWESGGDLRGDLATLICAVTYAAYVIALSRIAPRHAARSLAATQIVVVAAIACCGIALSGAEPAGHAPLTVRALRHLGALAYLGGVATAGMLFLQAFAQREVDAAKAALVYTLEPVFATLFGWLWLGESLGWRGAAGAACVLLAMAGSEWRAAAQPAVPA